MVQPMQLYMAPPSPFARCARVTFREAGLAAHVEEIPVSTTALDTDAALAAANPAGKIPTLLRDDGPALYDSRVINRYFDHVAEAGLYPDGRLWEILTLEATAHGLMEAAVTAVYEARFKGTEGKSADWIAAQKAKISRILGALEGRWMSHLAGPTNAGQIAVGCGLGYLDLRFPENNWRADVPTMADWFERFADRPAMRATAPD